MQSSRARKEMSESTNVINIIPQSLNDIIVKLSVVGAIGHRSKLNVSTLSVVDGDSWSTSISRCLYGEDRRHTLNFITSLMMQAFDALKNYHQSEFEPLIIKKLIAARGGVHNLVQTYIDDIYICCELNQLLENIDIQLKKHKLEK